MKERAYKLMKLWCDTLLSYQVKTNTPYTNNALLCPACHVIHGRIADLCFPLTVLWQKTGDEKYLTAADNLIDWSEYNLKTERGLWHNDVGNLWTGVSAFSAMSIGEALFHFQDILPEKLKMKWYTIFIRLVDAVMQYDKDIVFLCREIKSSHKEAVLVNQLLRSATSIGANLHEAQYAQSKNDFISKLEIAQKECYETEYWLELLFETDCIEDEDIFGFAVSFEKDVAKSVNYGRIINKRVYARK